MNNQITFIGTNIPQPGDNITVDAVINYNAYVGAGGYGYGPYGGPPGYEGWADEQQPHAASRHICAD